MTLKIPFAETRRDDPTAVYQDHLTPLPGLSDAKPMSDESLRAHRRTAQPSCFAAAAKEDLLLGARRLNQAFLQTPMRHAGRDAPLVSAGDPEPHIVLLRSGFAFRSCALADGRRSILDVLMTDDIAGLDNIVLAQAIEDITTASRVGYNALSGGAVRQLMIDPCIALHVAAVLAAARWRNDRLAASIGRLDAQARISVLLLDIHDRLRRQGLINRPSFNLPLTQEQIADHLGLTLVHVNRTLRKLREEKVLLVDRRVVIIMDLDRLRRAAQGLPQPTDLSDRFTPAERTLAN
jgi:CRP/FNR family transcriptional regulator, anaerobic regulatory protein